jgi:uncharacterized protein (DUF2236 family)
MVISSIVTEADLENELTMVRSAAAGGPAGIFGPESLIWRIDREAAIFLGAGRALLLQLAHPWVAAAIARHSRSLADPIGRFHRTFNIVFTMVFGTTSGTLTESAGAFPAGSPYRANDAAALQWVQATLTDTALVAYQLVNPPLSVEERERYYAETRLFAALFGIPQNALPQSWADFSLYVDQMFASDTLAVSGAARRVAAELFAGAGTSWRAPFWYRALTAQLLPPRLREEFGLSYSPSEQRSAARAVSLLRSFYPWLPSGLRYVGPYHEALARLAGRERPGALTQVMNRLWIGQSSMAIGGE